MRSLNVFVLSFLLLLPLGALGGGFSSADEEGEQVELSMRIFHVGALTSGMPSFIRSRAATEIDPDMDWDEDAPRFGCEGEEPWYPVGTVDELIEILHAYVRPEVWDQTEGADLAGLGEHRLVARAPKAVLDEMARFIADLERRLLANVTVEIQAVKLSPEEALLATRDGGSVDPAALAGDNLLDGRAGPTVTITAYPGQRASASSGRQHAYVADYYVKVAESAALSHPVVSVANLGLHVDVTPELGDDGRTIRLSIDGVLSRLEASRRIDTGEGRTVEVPVFDVVNCRADIIVHAGKWQLVQGRAGDTADAVSWFLLVRATLGQHIGRPTSIVSETLDTGPFDDAGMLVPRILRTRMFARAPIPTTGSQAYLTPSNFERVELPEQPEPEPILSQDALVELLMNTTGWAPWESGGSMEARNGMLLVRNTPAVIEALEGTVDKLRRQLLWSVETTAEVIELPGLLVRNLGRGGARTSGSLLLTDADRRAIDAALRSGEARRLDTSRVRNLGGVRNTITAGREVAYLSGYYASVAKAAAAGKPMVHRCHSGLIFDVDAQLLSTGDGASLDVRFQRTRMHEPLRTVHTPLGNVDVPTLDELRLRTSVTVPFGRTILLGGGGDDDLHTVLLLTPFLSRHD